MSCTYANWWCLFTIVLHSLNYKYNYFSLLFAKKKTTVRTKTMKFINLNFIHVYNFTQSIPVLTSKGALS